MFADIALNTKSSNRNDLFTYLIPHELKDNLKVGQMVMVPLGNRKVNGIVIEIHNNKPKFETKKIEKIIDPAPLIDEKMIQLARFISEYYWAGIGQTVFSFLPANLRKRKTKIFKEDNQIVKLLNCQGKEKQNNNLAIYQFSNLTLTSQQEKALEKISTALDSGKPDTFLLHGVTNSGKTEVYLRAFAKALGGSTRGQTSGNPGGLTSGSGIYIVPEIALTPQAIKRFEEVFGRNRIALIHSKLSIAQRLNTWMAIKQGKKDIIIGSRSAIFAPVQNLKLIIIDEEHDLISFKSDQTPRYELHRVAEKLAELSNSVLVLGSATPLVTSYKKVVDNEWEYLSMPERIDNSIPPMVKVINMEEEPAHNASHNQAGREGIFSDYLLQALEMVLKNKKQALLFLNRRGMASFILCQSCKKVSMCESCDSALVYHSVDNKLWCHHCGRKYLVPVKCDVCGGLDFRFLGQGTERIESEIRKYFPAARIARMDRDTMTSDEAYQNIFEKYKKGEIDILIGTQMIVHGWDIPAVDLAAVVQIDESLLIPDYTSEEKVFELIMQLAGRTGRGNSRGMLILQTFNPELLIYQTAVKNDYLSFAKRELAIREKFSYPPFASLIKLSLGGTNKDLVEKKAEDLTGKLNHELSRIYREFHELGMKNKIIEIVGPVSPLIEKKYNKYWKNIIIKFSIFNFQPCLPAGRFSMLESLRDELLSIVPKEWVIDIDPITLL